MKTKKLVAIVIAASVVLGTTSTAFASPIEEKTVVVNGSGVFNGKSDTNNLQEQKAKITKEKAREMAKAKLKEYLQYELEENRFQSRMEFRPSYYNLKDDYLWDLSWNLNEPLRNINVNVSINANTGQVVSMWKREYSSFEKQPAIPSITLDQAKEAVKDFVQKFYPEKIGSLKLIEENRDNYGYGGYQPVNYSFNYQRLIDGIVLEGDFLRLEVDGVTGKIVGFDSRWSEAANLPSASGVIGKDKAEEIFRKQTEMNLMYINYRNRYDYEFQSNAVKLVYNMGATAGNGIDAKSGAVLDYNYLDNYRLETKDLTPQQKAEWLKKAAEVKSNASEIDSTRAEQVILEKLKDIFGQDYKVDYLSYQENMDNYETNGRKAWAANFYKEVDGRRMEEGGHIVIDALTEGIISLYKYDSGFGYGEEFTPKLTWSQAYDAAIEAAAKFFPDRIKHIKTEVKSTIYKQIVNGKEIPQREYYFNFPRLVNGIVYNNDNININIDAKTGTIRQISGRWSDKIQFPSANGAMKADEAKEILFQKLKPELAYTLIPNNNPNALSSGEYRLIYRLNPIGAMFMAGNIDAFNGKMVNYDGQEMQESSSEFAKKIKGHRSEKELSILAFQGIIDTAAFELDKEVTKIDFARMLVDAKGYRPYLLREASGLKYSNVKAEDANYRYLQMAVYYGILENKDGEFDFNQKITREEMAKALVRLLGYENLAKVEDIFVLDVADSENIDKGSLGYMAIAKALGILGVEDHKLRIKDNATMVDLATGVYKVLGSLRNGLY
jgi:hypothetical protein